MRNTRSVAQDQPLGPSCLGKSIAMATYYILSNQPTPKQPVRPRPTKTGMAIVLKISQSYDLSWTSPSSFKAVHVDSKLKARLRIMEEITKRLFIYCSCLHEYLQQWPQRVVPRLFEFASPGDLIEMQILRPHLRPTKYHFLGVLIGLP